MSRVRPQKATFSERFNLNPEISRGLLALFLFIVSGLALLSFFSYAGVMGEFINALLAIAFGEVRYVFPAVLTLIAILLLKETEYTYQPAQLIGGILFFLSFNGLVHLSKPLEEMPLLARSGYGGGVVGLLLAWPLAKFIGYWGGLLILSGLFLAALIIIFNTTLTSLLSLPHRLVWYVGWFFSQLFAAAKTVFHKEEDHVSFRIKGEHETVPDEETTDDAAEDEPVEDHHFERKPVSAATLKKSAPEPATLPQPKPLIPVGVPKASNVKALPSLDLLVSSKSKPTSGDIRHNAVMIQETLKNFGIEVEMGEVRVGPTVTQYSLKPAKGIKLTRITALQNDLALSLAAHPLRIEAPIPGQSLVGIEVPNQKVAMVSLRELFESPEFQKRDHSMYVAVGKDVSGTTILADLPKMPHLLIAGATGSGKTVGINTLILSLLYQNTPETLRFIMVDPKRVELTLYNGIPHLLTPVITDPAKTVNALKWTIGEMERRFDLLAAAGKRDIGTYNKEAAEPLPFIVFVIDELADLMAMAASEVEAGIIRLAQMARAVGIHLVVATQRPSVEVITGLMKANIPGRMAFSVASLIDSRTILDCSGAEKLLGRGDMLFLTADLSKPRRVQSAYVSEEELKKVVNYLKGDEPPVYDESIVAKASSLGTVNMFGGASDTQDSLFDDAKKIIVESGKASASLLQRRLKVGYARAARLLDELEEAGIVGPADGAKPRELFTEHLRPEAEEELPEDEQTMDAGGTVFDPPSNTTNSSP